MHAGTIQKTARAQESAESVARYRVRTVEPDEWQAWDEFVRQSPVGTLFHTTRWLGTTGVPFRIYGCFDDHGLAGGMVVEIVGHQAAGHSFFTTWTDERQASISSERGDTGHMLNCPYLGIVLPPPLKKYVTTLTQNRNIVSALAEHVRDEFARIRCIMGPEVVDMQPFIWAGYTIILRYLYRVDLSNLDVVWSNMTDKRRNDIRKAERDGITVDDQGSVQDVLSLYKRALEGRQRFARSSELVDHRDEMLRSHNQCRSFVARDRSGEAVAGIHIVWDEKRAYYILGGYGRNVAHRGAGALAIWNAIRYAGKNLGLPKFDMIAAGDLPLERFLRDFGGHLMVAFVANYQRPSFSRDVKRVILRVRSIVRRDRSN
jgi:hypothetical protein